MRVLLGGIIGALAAAGAWMAIEHSTKQEFGWVAIVVGLVTGLAVHCAAGTGSRSSYGRGALAAILALLACVGSRQVYAKVMEKSEVAAVAEVAAGPSESGEAEQDEATSGEADAEEADSKQPAESSKLVLSSTDRNSPGVAVYGNMSFKQGLTQWDMLWLSMAALTAYVVGKGRDRATASCD